MLHYVHGHNEIIAPFVAQMIPHMHGRGFGRCVTIGVVNDGGDLIAGIVFHNWHPEAGVIEMTVAALPKSRWMTRTTLEVIRQFVFGDCKCQMLMMLVPADNEALLRVPAQLGFMLTRVPRLLGRERDAVLCCLTAEAWETSKFRRTLDAAPPLDASIRTQQAA